MYVMVATQVKILFLTCMYEPEGAQYPRASTVISDKGQVLVSYKQHVTFLGSGSKKALKNSSEHILG